MGTRGVFGFIYKGKYYAVYNHWDSYPDGLGWDLLIQVIMAIENGTFDLWLDKLEKITIVNEDLKPTAADIEKLKSYTDITVADRNTNNWYCLLRNTQGSFASVLDSGYINHHGEDDTSFQVEEYAYFINYDTHTFDFYDSTRLESKTPLKSPDLSLLAIKFKVPCDSTTNSDNKVITDAADILEDLATTELYL